jgi:hypothetical protein
MLPKDTKLLVELELDMMFWSFLLQAKTLLQYFWINLKIFTCYLFLESKNVA